MKCFGMQETCSTIHDHSGTYISFLSFIHHIHAYKYINHHILHEKSLRLCINMNEGNETIDWYISETAVFTISKSNNNQDPLLKTQILN